MTRRFTDAQLATWRRDGAVLLERFFTATEVAAVAADFEALYGTGFADTTALDMKKAGEIGGFSSRQFRHFDDMPFDSSPAMNLLGLHPALIELARAALETDAVHLYQAHSWAKYTGEADYDQLFHCDYKNHTLTVPADDGTQATLNCMIYLTDVTDAHGAIHYVPQPLSDTLAGADRMMFADDDLQRQLAALERSGAGPAGSVFAYGIDLYHRGTNLRAPGAHRFTLTASYKRAGNEVIGWSAWPFHFTRPWHLIFDNATPEQLGCLGVPLPGDPFWTPRTLRRTRERWPGWDASAYEAALRDLAP